MSKCCLYLDQNIRDDDQERPEEIEEEPMFNRLDVRADGEAGGH